MYDLIIIGLGTAGINASIYAKRAGLKVAVIEMGINDFGEMSRLAEMAKPDIFIMTKIGYAHIEELGSLEGVLKAKTEAFAYMKSDGIAVMNGDDAFLMGYDSGLRRITFGLEEHNDFRAENITAKGVESIELDIVSETGSFPIKIPAYGSHLPGLAPAAALIGRRLGLTDIEISRGFLSYAPVDGRSNVINPMGITLIDDCYNANPNSVKAALTSLSALKSRRVAILGDMLDMGDNSEQLHRDVGMFAASCNIDVMVCQGEHARFIYEGFNFAGGKTAHYYKHMHELSKGINPIIKKGDAVLVKASHSMHFEQLLPIISGSDQCKKTT